VNWLKNQGHNLYLMSASDKIIKLWKVSTKYKKEIIEPSSLASNLVIPKVRVVNKYYQNSLKKSFANLHNYHINSVSLSTDCETFISSDDLSVNLWNIDREDQCQNLIDLKTDKLPSVTEVITTSKFSPASDSEVCYATSSGMLRLLDLRSSKNREICALRPADHIAAERRGLFAQKYEEIINCISDFQYSPDGRYLFVRDLVSVTVWDLHFMANPFIVRTDIFNPNLEKLETMNNSEAIYEKQKISVNCYGDRFATGTLQGFVVSSLSGYSYSAQIHQYKLPKFEETSASNKKEDPQGLPGTVCEEVKPESLLSYDSDLSRRVVHLDWNPKVNMIAAACKGTLYFYSSLEKESSLNPERRFTRQTSN